MEFSNTLHLLFDKPEELPEELKIDIPLLPKSLPLDRHYHLNAVYEWTLMRSFVMANKSFNGLAKRLNDRHENKTPDENDKFPWVQRDNVDELFMTNYYPSVYGYYNLLPKHIREHPAVVTTTIGLERYAHAMSLETKHRYLNMAAKIAQPTPDRFLIRFANSRRVSAQIPQVPTHCLRSDQLHRSLGHRKRLHQQQKAPTTLQNQRGDSSSRSQLRPQSNCRQNASDSFGLLHK